MKGWVMFKKIVSAASGIAALLGLYLLLIQTTALSVSLASLEAGGTESASVQLVFTNDGEIAVTVSEVDLFFVKRTLDLPACSGNRIGRAVFKLSGEDVIAIDSGKQVTRAFDLQPSFRGESRFSLCGIFEVNHRKGTKRPDAIALFEFSVLEGELDGPDLDRETHRLLHTRSFRLF